MKKLLALVLALVTLCLLALPAVASDVNPYLQGETSLAKPAQLSVSTGGKAKQLVLRWSAVPRAHGYQVLRSETGKTGSYKAVITTTDTTFTDKALKHSRTYYYAVRAFAFNGEKTIYSPYKKAALSTRVSKSFVSGRFVSAYQAMNRFTNAFDRDAVEKGTAIAKIRNGWYGYYLPFTLEGCSTRQDAVTYLTRFFAKKAAKSLAKFFLKTIDGKLYLWLPQDRGFGTLVINDTPTLKISYSDKKIVCKIGTYVSVDPELPFEYWPIKLPMVYEKGRWVFADDDFWYGFNYAYDTFVTPNDGRGPDEG